MNPASASAFHPSLPVSWLPEAGSRPRDDEPGGATWAGGLLWLFDLGWLCALSWALPSPWPHPGTGKSAGLAWALALLGASILHDPHFVALAGRSDWAALRRSHTLRGLGLLAGVVLVMLALPASGRPGADLLLLWLTGAWLGTGLGRALLAGTLSRLQDRGTWREVVAVVGSGPVAERLVAQLQQLQRLRPGRIELLGVFDETDAAAPLAAGLSGHLADLMALGRRRRIDWIVLTLPPGASQRLDALVLQLKVLAVPLALCPQDFDVAPGSDSNTRIGPSHIGWRQSVDDFLPRWVITLVRLPLAAHQILLTRAGPALALRFDNHDLPDFTALAAGFGSRTYAYVVTPNADHVIRLSEQPSFRALHAEADFSLLDSRFMAHLLHWTQGLHLPVCTGSDLTEQLLAHVVAPDDPLVLIGGTADQARQLRQRYGLRALAHLNPPMGFVHDAQAVQDCLGFIEAHSPFRFCLLAVGSPQQEVLAQQLKRRGRARGLALCIGASINFLTGQERRAPRWLQQLGMEWSWRLMQAPLRMAHRYLLRGPRVFQLLWHARIELRGAAH